MSFWDPEELDAFWQREIELRQEAIRPKPRPVSYNTLYEDHPLGPCGYLTIQDGWDARVDRPTGGHESWESGI